MKREITIEIDEDLLNGLNNAVISYGEIVSGIWLCCDVPDKFKGLRDLPFEEIENRFNAVKNLYLQIEREMEG